MNCLASLIKFILYIFNVIFVICGILLIVLGSLMLSNVGDVTSVSEALQTGFNYNTIPILIICLGAIIFVVSFFGCCGAIRESYCCTVIYSTFMFILLCLQIALVVYIFVEYNSVLSLGSDFVTTAWNENNEEHSYPMDAIQMSFKCCGLTSWENYGGINQAVPNSCCGKISPTATCEQSVYSSRPGCLSAFESFWKTDMNIIRYAGIGVAVVELVALIFSCILCNSFRKTR